MKEILDNLLLLQHVDSKLLKLESVKGDLPQQVAKLNEEVKQSQNLVAHAKEKMENTLKERHLIEKEINDLEESKKKFQDQLYEVKNNREYDAVTHEIESVSAKISANESRVLELMGIEEETQIELKNSEEALAKIEEKLKNQRAALEITLAKTEKDETALLEEKTKLASHIDGKILIEEYGLT